MSDDKPSDVAEEQRETQERARVLVEGLALEAMTGTPAWWRESLAEFDALEGHAPTPPLVPKARA